MLNNVQIQPKKSFLKRFWWLFLIIVILIVIMFVLSRIPKRGSSDSLTKENDNCKDGSVVFTSEFTDLTKIDHLAPIGAIKAGSAGRSYIFVKKDANGSYPLAPIYTPINSTITGITYARRGGPSTEGEYRLDIEVGCGIKYFFDHIDTVNEKIKALAPQTPADDSRTGAYVSIPIKAGELLGNSDGTPQAHAWDFSVMNMNKANSFINLDRWQWEQNKNAVCPYDFYSDDLKNKYYSAIALWDGAKSETPYCGNPSHDVTGTLSGGWYQGDATDIKGPHLIVGGFISMVELVIDTDGDNRERFEIRDSSPKSKPEDIKVGGTACYTDNINFAYLKLVSDNELTTVTGKGSCPSSFPANNVETWQR